MKYIERSLEIVNGEIETDVNSYNFALKELIRRRDELAPLINECIEKDLDLKCISKEINDEWNSIILAIAKSNYKTNEHGI